jgi:hypothetical protein
MTSASTLASTIFKTSRTPGEKVACSSTGGAVDGWLVVASISAKQGVKVRPANPAKKLKRVVPKEGVILAILINVANCVRVYQYNCATAKVVKWFRGREPSVLGRARSWISILPSRF